MRTRNSIRPVDSATDSHAQSIDDSKLAQLIANGELPFPSGLATEDANRLAVMVRIRRRNQLVSFLARQVAQYLHDHRPASS